VTYKWLFRHAKGKKNYFLSNNGHGHYVCTFKLKNNLFQLTLLISTPGKASWADEYEDEEG
jgi:hypothetical protein